MRLISLEINNFRQFYGVHRIDFSTDKTKNITLIHAENGAGKTALLNSIRWCLHESFTPNFPDTDKLINNTWRDEGNRNYSVRIQFEEAGALYSVTRGVETHGTKYLVVHKADANGEFKKITQDPSLFINSVMPREMANYFFFQGEGIGRVTSSHGSSEVKEAIHEVLGFTLAKQAIRDLNEIKAEYVREIRKLDKSDELAIKEGEYERCLGNIQELEERIVDYEEEVALFNKKIYDIDQLLSQSNHEVIREKQKQRSQLEEQLKRAVERLASSAKNKISFIRDYGNVVFAHELTTQAMDFIDENELKGVVPAPYNKQLIEDILEQKHCICGAPIGLGSEAYTAIVSMLEKAGDPVLNNRISRARGRLSELKRLSSKASDAYHELLEREKETLREVEELKRLIDSLSKDISNQNYSDSDIRALEKNRRDNKELLLQSSRDLGKAESEIVVERKREQRLLSEITRLQGNTPQVKKYIKLRERATTIADVITNKLDEFEREMPKILIGKINAFLERFVRQNYKAKIEPKNYEIFLYDESDRRVAMSDGQSLLLSLTFISSLIELARDRKNFKNEILTPGAIAPFVIDAPFGDLDNTYKANVARSIPETVDQVVFLLSSSHWEGLVEEAIRERVGSEYTVQVEVVGPQGDKEVDSIEINGKVYPSVKYDQPVPRSNVIKVL